MAILGKSTDTETQFTLNIRLSMVCSKEDVITVLTNLLNELGVKDIKMVSVDINSPKDK